LTREATSFIHSNRDQPFLAYLSHYTVHIPLQAQRELVAKYEQKAGGLPKTNSARFLPEGNRQARQVQDHPVYAAMVESLDQSVGTILQTLDQLGLADNTIVIFFSDNGGLSTAEGTPTSNVPLRAGKGWMYEGGIREPLIVRWPRALGAGQVISEPVISTDFFPTMLEMARLPQRPEMHVDGQSLLPLMKGGPAPKREGLFWHYPHYSNQGGAQVCAVRSGNWKLIRSFEGLPDELYDLNNDVGEAKNLASGNPEVVERLNQMLGGFLKATKAEMPRPNPDYVDK
jgi:arylsulfatase A-like enzyme